MLSVRAPTDAAAAVSPSSPPAATPMLLLSVGFRNASLPVLQRACPSTTCAYAVQASGRKAINEAERVLRLLRARNYCPEQSTPGAHLSQRVSESTALEIPHGYASFVGAQGNQAEGGRLGHPGATALRLANKKDTNKQTVLGGGEEAVRPMGSWARVNSSW